MQREKKKGYQRRTYGSRAAGQFWRAGKRLNPVQILRSLSFRLTQPRPSYHLLTPPFFFVSRPFGLAGLEGGCAKKKKLFC
jgi:hypothetical protein